MSQTILLIEDDPTQRLMLQKILEKNEGYHVQQAGNGKEALFFLTKTADHPADLVIMDIHMPEMNGLETLKAVKERFPELPVIMLSGSEDSDDIVTAMKLGAIDFLSKPADPQHLVVTVRNALKISSLSRELSRLTRLEEGTSSFEDLVGHDQGLAATVSLGRKAAGADVTVLITGETGVGKELFARAIHGESKRNSKPFIAVNCGAIPEKLVESTLFGHEKGAFTGATERTMGKFREAEGGTIFLDEVGELPLETQVKLLRVLQQQEVEPVGSAKSVPVDVRIISATNRNLEQEVRNAAFREDLFFRLHVFPIVIPPLRQRSEDIAPLAEYFLERFAIRQQVDKKKLPMPSRKLLEDHRWPGNVRELENILNRAFLLSDGETIEPGILEPILQQQGAMQVSQKEPGQPQAESFNFHTASGALKTMEQMERETLQYALRHYHDNVAKAAAALGIAKSTFYRKLNNM